MKTSSTLNGGVRSYVSIIPALFPAIVFLMISVNSQPIRMSSAKIEMSPLVERVRKIYTSELGVREKASNAGPDVEKYLRYVNLSKGNPWCAAFVCWVFGEAGVPNPRSGWSPSLFPSHKVIRQRGERGKVKGETGVSNIKYQEPRYAAASPKVFPSSSVDGIVTTSRYAYPSSLATGNWQLATPGTGDIFGLFFPEKARIAHVGFIDKWDGTWMISVEGNTNVSGSPEGDGVYRKRRLVRSIYRVARYIE